MSIALRFSRIEPEQQAQLLKEIHNILTEVGAHNVGIGNTGICQREKAMSMPLGMQTES